MGSSESIKLLEAVGLYISSLKSKDNQEEIQKELLRFVHWYGADRTLSGFSPPEIGEYADRIGGSRTAPQAAGHLKAVRDFFSYARKRGLINKNLALHVRVPKSKGRIGKTRDQDAIELTAAGHTQLVAQLEKLKGERAPLAQQIRKAAADRDVRENAPLEAAREQLGHLESRIMGLENTLKFAVIIDSRSHKRRPTVKLGTRVSIKDLKTGRRTQYTLVNRSEANPLEAKISDISPLGQVLMGSAKGQEVEAETPRGKIRYRILKVSS